MKRPSLPLGVDIGSTRVRILEAVATPHGPRVRAVAIREVASGAASSGGIADTEHVAALIEDALAEIRPSQRRCVASIGEPDAVLRAIRFPKMTRFERERSARFEAERLVEFPADEAVVRVHRASPHTGTWVIGVARVSAVKTRLAALRHARLKVVSIDHESCAFARALPSYDAIVDIGLRRASLHAVTSEMPFTLQTFNGGADVTRCIERELSLDQRSAEKRKRILGTAGAGESARAALTGDIAAMVRSAREKVAIAKIALVGNGSRLPGLARDLEIATGALCELPVTGTLLNGEYPEDVARSGAPDWTLAAGLVLWSAR